MKGRLNPGIEFGYRIKEELRIFYEIKKPLKMACPEGSSAII
jgi:hypothetical protein